jgi:hypothetical protein
MSRRLPLRIPLAAALCLLVLPPSVRAQEETRGFSLDLFGAYLSVTSQDGRDPEKSVGLRGSYRFTNVWALEGVIVQSTEDGDVDRLIDLAAKAYLIDTSHFEVYAVGGVGHSSLDGFTPNLGLGAEIPLGDHAFLRPEVRGRWNDEHVNSEYSLGVGWRF